MIKRCHRTVDKCSPTRMNRSVYDQDGLKSVHNHDFMHEPRFCRAYARGVLPSGPTISGIGGCMWVYGLPFPQANWMVILSNAESIADS